MRTWKLKPWSRSVTAEILLRRLHKKVSVRGDCWVWTGIRSKSGYPMIAIHHKFLRVHRLVAWMCLGFVDDGVHEVCHRCNVKLCIKPSHLYIATHAENMRDAGRDGLFPDRRGMAHPQVKLTETDVKDIYASVRSGQLQREVAAQYGVDRSTVTAIMRRKNWSHLDLGEETILCAS